MPPTRSSSDHLRRTIDTMPLQTRIAMLDGVRRNRIVSGAYVHGDGVCPMLAAHRCGGRTDFISFARAWDAFTGARRARRATRSEVSILIEHLEASLAAEEHIDLILDPRLDLGTAISEHRALQTERAIREEHDESAAPARTGRAGRISLRRRDDYDRALSLLESERERIAAHA